MDCGERFSRTNCEHYPEGYQYDVNILPGMNPNDMLSSQYYCVPNADAINGYALKQSYHESSDCSGDAGGGGLDTYLNNCQSNELDIFEVEVCYGDNPNKLKEDSGGIITECVSFLQGVAAGGYEAYRILASSDLCGNPSALPAALGAPDYWFINNCCETCGRAIGSDLEPYGPDLK